jgi:hypothetical protein
MSAEMNSTIRTPTQRQMLAGATIACLAVDSTTEAWAGAEFELPWTKVPRLPCPKGLTGFSLRPRSASG